MKTLRNLIVPVSVLVMFLGLAATGTKAQILNTTHFAGNFTLPFPAQWGEMTLPPGDYNLYFGNLNQHGLRVVEVAHEDLGILHGLVITRMPQESKATESFLVCVIEGNKAYVRSLEMAGIGQSVGFARPHGVSVAAWIVADKKTHNTNARLAETRIPVVPLK
jgi:hypothetical protein